MKLSDLMNIDDLDREILDGFVRVRTHPHDPDTQIFNYTEKAQYEKHWNYVTKQCRGLIHRRGEVLARPFDKFFNLGEHDYDTSDVFAPDRLVEMTDKMDGSLGILYPWPGDGFKMRHQWAIATRGSFESEQAIHATDVLRNKYPDFKPAPGFTYLFEIVYPENRIVLDYGDQDDLILLGMRNIDRGFIVGPQSSVATSAWPGAVTDFWGYMSFSKALDVAAVQRPNREGVVIRFLEDDLMVKVKQEDYVLLHKLVTGLNERAVWEHLSAHNGTYGDLLASVPDEFHSWVEQVAEEFLDAYETMSAWAHVEYLRIIDYVDTTLVEDDRAARKIFAREARETLHPALLFQLLDGRDIAPAIWKSLRPKGQTNSLMNRTEDNA